LRGVVGAGGRVPRQGAHVWHEMGRDVAYPPARGGPRSPGLVASLGDPPGVDVAGAGRLLRLLPSAVRLRRLQAGCLLVVVRRGRDHFRNRLACSAPVPCGMETLRGWLAARARQCRILARYAVANASLPQFFPVDARLASLRTAA